MRQRSDSPGVRAWRGAVLACAAGCGSSSPAMPDAPDPVLAVDAQRYLADLTAITGPRTLASAQWQAVQDLCATRFAELGFTVERHAYGSGINVVGVLPGTGVDERVLVSAHYDSTNNCPGADDNATGVAGTLEVARVLAAQPHARTLAVACWDQEEGGLIGSRAYAQRAATSGEAIVASIVFEMIGYRSTEPGSQRTDPALDAVFPDQTAAIAANEYRGDFLLVVHDESAATVAAALETTAAARRLPTIVLPLADALKSAASGLRRSDHASFWDIDVPAILLTDTAEFRNPHYHCRGGADVIDDIDLEFATLSVQAAVGAAAAALDP